jgi:thiol-disulfide isomerase/thioredoxin
MKNMILAVALLVTAVFAIYASQISDELESKLAEAESDSTAMALIQQYAPKMTEVDDLRRLQNNWMQLDKQGCKDYFSAKHKELPNSEVYYYLWLRTQDDRAIQLTGARELIALKPDFYWGYRVFANTYAQIMLDPETPEALKNDIQTHLKTDFSLLLDAQKRFPQDDYVKLALFHYYGSQGQNSEAEAQIIRLQEPSAIQTNFDNVIDFVAASKRTLAFEALYPKLLSTQIASGEISADDSLLAYKMGYLGVMERAGLWDRMRLYFSANPELLTMDDTIGLRIAMEMGLEHQDTALNLLEGAMATNIIKYPDVADEPYYEPLHNLPRWNEVMSLAAKNWEQGKAERKAKALAKKVSKPAPLWELPDKDGKMLRLESLRGQIVVLDFWATWCKPCRKTMPLLDAWLKANKAKDVTVISVNTWESPVNQPLALAYMQDNRFSMQLLFGNNELPKAYGFTGIPYICVIDKKGNIAYEINRYDKELPELLDFWTEDLRK